MAAREDYLPMADLLLVKSADPNRADEEGWTPWTGLPRNATVLVADLLFAKGAGHKKADEEGRTPLCMAACESHLPVANLLLVKGADPNKADEDGGIRCTLLPRKATYPWPTCFLSRAST